MGSKGLPRRTFDYLPMFQGMHGFSSFGAFIMGIGFMIVVIYLIASLKNGKAAGDNPWGASTLEWTTTSPPHPHNFLRYQWLRRGRMSLMG